MRKIAASRIIAAIPHTATGRPADAGPTPLIRAVLTGSLDDVKKALAGGADVNLPTGSGVTPLARRRCRQGRRHRRRSRRRRHRRRTDQMGTTPLMTAACRAHARVEALIRRGANPNIQDKTGMTALMAAASSGRLDMVRFLVDRGADVNGARQTRHDRAHGGRLRRPRRNRTSVDRAQGRHQCRRRQRPYAVDGDRPRRRCRDGSALLAAKADVNAEDKGGLSALSYAAGERALEVVELLLKAGLKKGLDTAVGSRSAAATPTSCAPCRRAARRSPSLSRAPGHRRRRRRELHLHRGVFSSSAAPT
jgi:ankyrin repeat protein